MKAVVVMPYRDGGCEHRRAAHDHVVNVWRRCGFEVVEGDDPGEPFSRAASMNRGTDRADADIVICADADVIVTEDAIRAAVAKAGESDGLVNPFTRYRYLNEAVTQHVYSGSDPWSLPAWFEFGEAPATPLKGGLNVYSKRTWETIGGFPERFRGWGCEDLAIDHIVRVLVAPMRRIDSTLIHLFHPKTGEYADAGPTNAALADPIFAATTEPELRAILNG